MFLVSGQALNILLSGVHFNPQRAKVFAAGRKKAEARDDG